MLKPPRHPTGYTKLLVYRKSDELQSETAQLTALFPKTKTLTALADQMNRSARSGKQNIVEGWKRNSTKEYYEFLGFSVGSIAELAEDCLDIWRGKYSELVEVKGIIGERGGKGLDIGRLPFYPLDPLLPLVIQVFLRAKELDYLLDKLQKSLIEKMIRENTLPVSERRRLNQMQEHEFSKWLDEEIERLGLVRLEDGRVVKKGGY